MNLIEYKSRQYKELELPSGLKVKLKRLSPFKFLEFIEIKGLDLSDLDSYSNKFFIDLLIELSVEPKISERETSESNLCIYDIEPDDASILISEIVKDISLFRISELQ
jgi:hypothetical protein